MIIADHRFLLFMQRSHGRHLSGKIGWVLVGMMTLFAGSLFGKNAKGPPAAISYLYPPGGKAGSSFQCTVAGTFTKTKATAWADHPGIVFKGTPNPAVFQVTIAPEVPPGPHLVRFYNDEEPHRHACSWWVSSMR